MSQSIAIEVHQLSKRYRLGEIGTGTLSHDLERAWARIRGKQDPFAMVGQENDREMVAEDYVWALRDINLSIAKGEKIGLIGANGAGKSTLLKLLSRITAPTTGRIRFRGRIASLLEVGTGFNPELTGRDNIFINGAILGMSRREIADRFDEIVEFSGCRKYVDTPVKRYSSGMMVRLGFAVAAHLNSEILIVDEVLAVGDREFQSKCLGKLGQENSDGKTVLFVSHNLASVRRLCDRCYLMHQGSVVLSGNPEQCINQYRQISSKTAGTAKCLSDRFIASVSLSDPNGGKNVFDSGDELTITIEFNQRVSMFSAIAAVYASDDTLLTDLDGLAMSANEEFGRLSCQLGPLGLMPGEYYINLLVRSPSQNYQKHLPHALRFTVSDVVRHPQQASSARRGIVEIPYQWSTSK